ncbi:uncharacterized protein LOC128386375 isoform X2 [Panonychus citri]|uniref:uncharacterized protein LOC128386375 isoform X2 n=1 Tax=Panonychus citri TaxID=50023 RepID=UPI00230702D6|nr:uncharacterized protein LOC128386375 isoform X2 [Panonychus citri]
MSFDKLPENCLWKIFDNFDELEELIQLSKVCSKWSNLISIRFSKVKYLLHSDVVHFDYSKIWIEKELTFKYNLRKLLPNLRILNVSCGVPYTSMNFNVSPPEVRDHFKFPPEYFQDVVNNNPKIKGVLGIRAGLNLDLENIEMVEMDYMLDCKRIFRPDQLRQIRFKRDFFFESLPKYIEYFPNLKRLNITFNGKEVLYNGPNLCNLKVLEFASDRWNLSVYGFYLMNFCPSLESAFMSCSDGLYSISPSEQNVNRYTDISLKNYNLRDLVIKKHYGVNS